MDALLRMAAANTIVAFAITLLALVSRLHLRRPALTHFLWLLVLVKLLTPPVVSIPIHLRTVAQNVAPQPVTLFEPVVDEERPSQFSSDSGPELGGPTSIPTVQPRRTFWQRVEAIDITRILLAAWILGSMFCVSLALVRLRRFHRILSFADAAPPDVIDRVASLARKLGIRRPPAALFIPAPVSPMLLGGFGRPRLLVPHRLWQRLDDRQRDALLLHELAHMRRLDHLVRGIELLATVLYWWNPLTWLARRQLRIAEELCCDAWVTHALPAARDDYAAALVEAIDFASASRPTLPLLASGVGEFKHLQRRLLMIRNGVTNRKMGWTAMIALAVVVILPLSLTRAQDQSSNARSDSADATDATTRPSPTMLQKRLSQTLPELNLENVPFSVALERFTTATGVKLDIDWNQFEEAGISKDASITLKLKNVEISSALAQILGAAPLVGTIEYGPEGDVMKIRVKQEPDSPDEEDKPQSVRLLDRTVPEMNFNAVAFEDVLDYFRQQHFKVVANWRALERAGIAQSTPITMFCGGKKFSQVLIEIFRQIEGSTKLGYSYGDDTVTISTATELSRVGRIYKVRSLFGKARGKALMKRIDEIAGQIDLTDSEGEVSLSASGTLIVIATPGDQQRVAVTLDRLRNEQAADKPENEGQKIEQIARPATQPTERPAVSDADKKTAAQLNRVCPDVNFQGIALGDAIDFMRDVTGANINANWKQLEAQGINRNKKIELKLSKMQASAILHAILEQASDEKPALGYRVDDGVVNIIVLAQVAASQPANLPAPKAADKQTQAQLDRTLPELSFEGVGLSDVIDFLRDVSGANIVVNWKSLEAAGIDRNTPITLKVRNIKFSKALSLILENATADPAKVAYKVDQGVISIYAPLVAPPNVPNPNEEKRAADAPRIDPKVQALLDKPVSVSFDATPLREAIDKLRDASGAKIFVNWIALQQVGVSRDDPVTLQLRNARLRKTIELLLNGVRHGNIPLGFTVDEDVISITTQMELARNTLIRVYDIRDILGDSKDQEREKKVNALLNAIADSVEPGSWRQTGGIIGSLRELQGQLIITQTPENQRKVMDLLAKYREEHRDQLAPTTRPNLSKN